MQLKITKDVSWVKNRNTDGYTFFSNPVAIDANIDRVWDLVTDVEHYKDFSHHAVVAKVDGPVAKGTTIELEMYPEDLKGKFIPKSEETISIVDADNRVIGWERDVPFSDEPTERYQVLEAVSDVKTNSYIGLKIKGAVGFFTDLVLKDIVEDSFNDLNNGIKEEAEKRFRPVSYI